MRIAICVLNDIRGEAKGIVRMTSAYYSPGVHFEVKLWGLTPGKYGFHVHRSGNLSQGSHSLCDHYSTHSKTHGGLNDPFGHEGDLGNLTVNESGECQSSFLAKYVSLEGDVRETIIGRSLVMHTQEDDLGLGKFPDSKTTGHSGDRMLYGIIGIDENCSSPSRYLSAPSIEDSCSIF